MTLGQIATKARLLTNTDTSQYTDANLLVDINLWLQKLVATMIYESQDESDFDDARRTTYAQGYTTRESALNDIRGLGAQQALQTQELIRQGNIAGAKALVDASAPASVSPGSSLVSPLTGQESYSGLGGYTGVQAIQTYNNLQQTFPDANIPAYNQAFTPQQNLQIAQQAAQQAPSFQSRNLVPVQLPGGGYTFVNKNQVVTGSNGQASIISSADAAQAQGYQKVITDLTGQKAQISTAIQTIDNNFPILSDIVKQYKLNTGVPLYNQFGNMADKNLGSTGIYQLNSIVTGLKASISQIIGAGGAVDDKVRAESDNLLPNTASYKVLNDLYAVIKKEGAGRISAFDNQINNATNGLNKIYSTASTPSAASGGGSLYDF
jgi:hypothetical protein